jgi:hypothetical protein
MPAIVKHASNGAVVHFYPSIAKAIYTSPERIMFENNDSGKLSLQIYIDSKPAYYNFVEKTPMLTQEDILSLFK